MTALRVGDVVRYAPNWCEPQEASERMRVTEIRGDRVLVQPVEWPYFLVPVECVLSHMVERVEA